MIEVVDSRGEAIENVLYAYGNCINAKGLIISIDDLVCLKGDEWWYGDDGNFFVHPLHMRLLIQQQPVEIFSTEEEYRQVGIEIEPFTMTKLARYLSFLEGVLLMKHRLMFFKMSVISLLLLTGCAGVSDYDVDLPGDYSIVRSSAHNVTIAPKEGSGGWGSAVIPTKVTEVAWDKNYIIAKQVDLKQDPKNKNYHIPNKQNYHYWILDIKTGKVTGPLDDESLKEKRTEFKISNDVFLNEIEKIKLATS
ncbi:DUF3997 domain-containing protein [Bacillus sp. DX1.1]|uniref:DUF7003 family protein n=1 Tax=unclassified Bacillus (in: firmicutes) TaxID=185979 RepID=UPI0025702135|nr:MULTISPECIES: DUF3997 domain-containing protein [unclassified Bacillus (in: firmicutes)]MDM5154994.1 DUF3997 domain-containing protein [Bacillus sp. DX1.1]WJE83857.1 DUF3997 domain-containing protein [Bacillus sp. DX3.1]